MNRRCFLYIPVTRHAKFLALRKELQQRGTPSARHRLKMIGQRENRWMCDVNHCISKALVENNSAGTLFVLENLSGIRGATERVRTKDRYVVLSTSIIVTNKIMFTSVRTAVISQTTIESVR